MEKVDTGLKTLKLFVNGRLSHKQPWEIVALTSTTVLTAVWLWGFLFKEESLYERSKSFFFKMIRKVPSVRRKVEAELETITNSFYKDTVHRLKGMPYVTQLHEEGQNPDAIIKLVKEYVNLGEYDWSNGFVSGTVYYHNTELIDLLTKVYGVASYTNPLHTDVFPGICKMEAEVVRICANLFHGGPEACGTMTSGGTESIIMACKAYRDYAKAEKGISNSEIVLPITAHPAFDKAASYFKMRMKHIPVDQKTWAVDIVAMERAITSNTCMLVGSAPNYPYGTADNIKAIAELGLKYNIPVHADCCLGGFLTAFMPAAGFPVPPFDFSVPGVTSISADTHKYGFAPKGSSVILYSEEKYRAPQFCVTTDWPGGIYGSPTVNGSRAGGIIAACWATLAYFGWKGYIEATKGIIETSRYIENELRKIDSIFIFGTPMTSVIAIGSNSFHIYLLSEALSKKGWSLNPLQFPVGIHLCVTHMHTSPGVADKFIQDVKDSTEVIMKTPSDKVMGKMAVYGMSQSIPDRSLVDEFTRLFIKSTYYTPKSKDTQSISNGCNKQL